MGELNLRDFMEIDLFYLGLVILVLNEGFVMSRHYCSYLRKLREQIIEKYGLKWTVFHSSMDVLWLVWLFFGFDRAKHLNVLLGIMSIMILFYIPVLYKKYKGYNGTGS